MEDSQLIEPVTQELRSGNPLMGFKPDDVTEKFFIGEAIVTVAATIFVTAFLKGVEDALKVKGEELGKTVTNWVVDKIGGLFRKPQEAKAKEEEAKKQMHEVGKSASKIDKKTRDSSLDKVEAAVIKELENRGVQPKKAKEIARKSRAAAEIEISKASKHGTK